MDLVCTRCGEPWDIAYVLQEEPDAFRRRGGLIQHCPSCPTAKPQLDPEKKLKLVTVAAMAKLMGDDVNGLAAVLRDCGLSQMETTSVGRNEQIDRVRRNNT